MSKTLSRSLPALLLGLCMLVAQMVAFSQSSPTAHAAGATITVSNGSTSGSSGGTVSIPAGTTVTVAGSGFTAGSTITITFNAPGPNTSTAAAITSVARPGDNTPSVSTAGGSNDITVTAIADSTGKFSGTAATSTNPAATFTIPATSANGTYYVSAVDNSASLVTAPAVAVNVTGSTAAGGLTLSTSVAPIGGSVFITSGATAFPAGGTVSFSLMDFTAGGGAGAQPVGAGTVSTPAFSGVTAAPLQVLACATTIGGTAAAVPAGTTTCPVVAATGATSGSVAANVQLASAAAPILSTTYGDQVFAIVATSGATTATAGIRINHTLSSISVATNSVPLNGSVSVSGSGFGANSTVWVYFVPSSGALTPNNPGLTGPGFFSSSSGGTSLLVTPSGVTANASGGFTASVSLPSAYLTALGSTSVTGYFLAEDFSSASYPADYAAVPAGSVSIPGAVAPAPTSEVAPGARLNFPAIAAVNFLAGLTTANTLFITPAVAAVNGTVTVTGTLGLNEPVVISLQSSATNAAGTQCPKQLVTGTTTNSAGVFSATFTVPQTCSLLTTGGVNTPISGSTVTVTAAGQNSGQTLTGTFTVPATNVTIAAGTIANTVVISGTGLGANEPAIVQISLPNPFSGLPQVLFSATGTTNASGTVVVNGTLPAAFQSGLYNLTVTGVNTGLTKTNLIQLPLAATGTSQLNCPTSVLAGQPFVISGVGLAPNASVSVSIPFTSTGTVGTIFSNATAGLTQSFVAGATAGFGTANATLTANATGAYSVTVALPLGISPSTTGYPLTVTAPVTTGGVAQIFTCNIVVGTSVPTLTSSLSSGTVGITTTLTGAGFAASEPVNISLVYTGTTALSGVVVPGTTQTVVVSPTGSFSTIYTIASTVNALVPGTYLIQAQGQNTKLTAYAPFTVTGAAGTTTTSTFFPEGYTGTVAGGANADFTEILSILNTNNFTTTYTVNYFLENAGAASTTTTVSGTIGANSVVQRSVNTDAGANKEVAAQVVSPAPLSAERIINRSIAGKALDASSSQGQAVNLTATGPFTYYFASGEVQLTNEEYLTLLNPTATSTTATITIVPQVSISATTAPTVAPITQVVPPMSRVTVPIRKDLVASGLTKFGIVLTSNAAPLASERVEYYGDGIGSGKYGATTKPAGTTAFRQYIFAASVGTFPSSGGNGSIGTGSDLSEIDIINPGAASAGSATVTVSFFDKAGAPINSQQVQVDGGTRETINVNDVVGTQADVFSAVVTSDKSVYVEKPTFYGGDPNLGGTHAVAAPTGAPSGLTSASFPYLDTATASGAPLSQTVFLYNPGATSITVNGTFVTGGSSVTKTYTVAPNSITTVNVNADTATLPAKTPIGGMFQLVSTSTTVGQSFVSALTTNTANFSMVLGDQGTNLIGQ